MVDRLANCTTVTILIRHFIRRLVRKPCSILLAIAFESEYLCALISLIATVARASSTLLVRKHSYTSNVRQSFCSKFYFLEYEAS